MIIERLALILAIVAILAVAGCGQQAEVSRPDRSKPTESGYIDTQVHLNGIVGPGENDFEGAAGLAVKDMDKWNVEEAIVMPPPFSLEKVQQNLTYEIDDMTGVLQKYPGRFAFLGGGEELNVMIQKAVKGNESIDVEQFKSKARQVADMEGFVGFGEMATMHFSLGEGHDFIAADPDHELYKALVDVAAERDVPIDIHHQVVPADMPFPTLVTGGSPANPAALTANMDRFRNLLEYARSKNVKIVWAHVGWDNTGYWTASLCDELLGQYDNLYMNIKVSPRDSLTENRVVESTGEVKPEWLALFEKYPDRFMIGSDQFFVSPRIKGKFPPSMDETWSIVDQLPDDLKGKIGRENAVSVFKLDQQ